MSSTAPPRRHWRLRVVRVRADYSNLILLFQVSQSFPAFPRNLQPPLRRLYCTALCKQICSFKKCEESDQSHGRTAQPAQTMCSIMHKERRTCRVVESVCILMAEGLRPRRRDGTDTLLTASGQFAAQAAAATPPPPPHGCLYTLLHYGLPVFTQAYYFASHYGGLWMTIVRWGRNVSVISA